MADHENKSVEFNADGQLWAGGVRDLEKKLERYFGVDGIGLQETFEGSAGYHHEAMVLRGREDTHLLSEYVGVIRHGPSGAAGVSKEDLPSKEEVENVAQ